MAERRSIGAAMEMTPEKLAFISAQSKPATASPPSTPREKEGVKTVEVVTSQKEPEKVKGSAVRPSRRNRSLPHESPGASEILDQVLVPVTIRLPRRIAHALKRAYLEQRLKCVKPDSLQEIAREALEEWLSRVGYLAD